MKKKILLVPLCAFLAVCCCGCTQMVSLTDQEANTVALYSAQIVSKYNRSSSVGLGVPSAETGDDGSGAAGTGDAVSQSAESDGASGDTASQSADTNTGTGDAANQSADTNGAAGDAAAQPETADGAAGNGDTSGTQGETAEADEASYVSFNDAVGISGLSVEYAGYEVEDSVTEGSYFSMDSSDGKTYIVVALNLKNTTGGTLPVHILEMQPRFSLSVNDTRRVASQMSLLTNDFSTLSRDFAAGEGMSAELIFEVEEDVAESVSSLAMDVTFNGNTSKIKLL